MGFLRIACSWRGLLECRSRGFCWQEPCFEFFEFTAKSCISIVKLYMKGKGEDELWRDSFMLVRFPRDEGRDPSRLFSERSNTLRLVRFDMHCFCSLGQHLFDSATSFILRNLKREERSHRDLLEP
ncbi:hypothetical protein ISN45_Aa03g004820 [Arabidopsis thaliana x Arabidopsis arenosa]|uniref:Uncharacterized protein n=1 Tax=Arabidopsis thaliana x Arabidopsis arenosa TaxID=1240361 RepID=A0A8T2APP9_9BRAS|nr:hypothetical protein ISN45_Aa03g004820 [Arabidopsis thaliana x Arabidopsis arenosa]